MLPFNTEQLRIETQIVAGHSGHVGDVGHIRSTRVPKVRYDSHMAKDRATGRPRDTSIGDRIIAAARVELGEAGWDAFSMAAVAKRADTTRQALYRRYSDKADLVTAVIGSMARMEESIDTDSPFDDLVDELRALHRNLGRRPGVSIIGVMLQDSVDPGLAKLFRDRIIHPRRKRLLHILGRGVAAGDLPADADLDYAVAACSGIYYSLCLHGSRIPNTWPRRTASFVWRAAGGDPD